MTVHVGVVSVSRTRIEAFPYRDLIGVGKCLVTVERPVLRVKVNRERGRGRCMLLEQLGIVVHDIVARAHRGRRRARRR